MDVRGIELGGGVADVVILDERADRRADGMM